MSSNKTHSTTAGFGRPVPGAAKQGENLIAAGLRCHKAGNLSEAERLYRMALNLNPRHADVLNLLGVVAVQAERPREAVDLIGKAVRLNDSKADFRYNLGLAHLALGDNERAMKCLRRALSLRPDYVDALVNLGNLLLKASELEEAEKRYAKAAELAPSNPLIHNNLGTVLIARQATEEAEPHFRRALELKPDYAEAHNGLGLVLGASGKFDGAIESFKTALRLKPNYAQAYNNLGNVYFDEDRLEDAEECLRKAAQFRSNYVQAERKLARVFVEQSNFEPALAIIERHLESNRDSREAWAGKANILDRMGRTEEGFEIVRRFATDGPPPLGMVHLYANLASKEHRQPEVAAEIEGMLAQNGQRDEHRRMLHFTLGRLYDEMGAFDEAFLNYDKGNHLRPTPFDPEKNSELADRMIEFFSAKSLAEMPRADNRSELPVFIVGMPRSGTSLVEQILSCHRDVHAAGELKDVSKLSEELGLTFSLQGERNEIAPHYDRDSLNGVAERHIERLHKLGGGAIRVTDKMPYNFWHLGQIALLFPRARIISWSNPARHNQSRSSPSTPISSPMTDAKMALLSECCAR